MKIRNAKKDCRESHSYSCPEVREICVSVEAGFENSSGDFDMDIDGWETGGEDNGGKAE